MSYDIGCQALAYYDTMGFYSLEGKSMRKRDNFSQLKLRGLLGALEVLDDAVTVSQFKFFLNIALSEGSSIVDLSEAMDYAQPMASRDMDVWSEIGRQGRPGLGYTERRDSPSDRRVRECYLSASGHKLAKRLAEAL
jgi:DNA-binding MarR family transcriptional regulator